MPQSMMMWQDDSSPCQNCPIDQTPVHSCDISLPLWLRHCVECMHNLIKRKWRLEVTWTMNPLRGTGPFSNLYEASLSGLDSRSQAGQYHKTPGLRRSCQTADRKLTLVVGSRSSIKQSAMTPTTCQVWCSKPEAVRRKVISKQRDK